MRRVVYPESTSIADADIRETERKIKEDKTEWKDENGQIHSSYNPFKYTKVDPKELKEAMDIDKRIHDIECGMSEPNKIQFTEKDGKILAELPVDDLISKEHNDSLDALRYALERQNKLDAIRNADLECQRNDDDVVKPDMVNHPPHYNVNGFEVIDIIKAFTEGLNGIAAVDTGNAIKYILRWHNKNGVEDLKKAKWYIEHLINLLEKESK